MAKLDRCFQEPKASQLAHMRIKARRKRNVYGTKKRLTYDCRNNRVIGAMVECPGHKFKGGMMNLLSVLKGISSDVCQKCKDYNGETTE